MAIDFSGGIDLDREHVFGECPTLLGMRDATNMWIWADDGSISFPRAAVEAIAPMWEQHTSLVTIAFPDGRVLRDIGPGKKHEPRAADGSLSILGAGPMSFTCVEPFRRYRATYSGSPLDTNYDNMVAGRTVERRVPAAFDLDCEAAAPAWAQGSLTTEAVHRMNETVVGDFVGSVGGLRYEQLMRVTGWVEVEGVRKPFTGGCLRIRRTGVRNTEGFVGHVWASAAFPSGRAFGYMAYPRSLDGTTPYNEGFVFQGDGKLIAARAVDIPWLRRIRLKDEDVGFSLETAEGTFSIAGTSVIVTPSIPSGDPKANSEFYPPTVQGTVRYEWDGEVAYGMIERSTLIEELEPFR